MADMLSRSPGYNTCSDSCCVIKIDSIFGGNQLLISADKIRAETVKDAPLGQLAKCVQKGWPAIIPNELKLYASVKDELSLCIGCILRADCVVFPTSLRGRLIELAHEGHPGVVRTLQRVREAAWWPGVSSHVRSMVTNCTACAMTNENNTCRAVPLMPVGWPQTAWSKIAINIVGELHDMPQSKRFAVTVIDFHSRWPEVVLVRSPSSPVVIRILSEMFSRWGLLEELVSDNGRAFISKEFKSFLQSCGIHHNRLSLSSRVQCNAGKISSFTEGGLTRGAVRAPSSKGRHS